MYYFMYKLESNYCDLPLKNFNTDLMQNLTQLHNSTAKFFNSSIHHKALYECNSPGPGKHIRPN